MKKTLLTVALLSVALTACQPEAGTKKQTQADKAKEAAQSVVFTENAEIENIKKRLELTSDPGKLGFVVLMNEAGQPVMYTSVVGKITSGGKRLTPPEGCLSGKVIDPYSCWRDDTVTAAPSDEGTWGSSSPYIFFWSASGQYIQWNGKYLYSDQPLRLSVEPLVIDLKTDK